MDIKRLDSLTPPISVTSIVMSTQAYFSALDVAMLVDETQRLPSDPVAAGRERQLLGIQYSTKRVLNDRGFQFTFSISTCDS